MNKIVGGVIMWKVYGFYLPKRNMNEEWGRKDRMDIQVFIFLRGI